MAVRLKRTGIAAVLCVVAVGFAVPATALGAPPSDAFKKASCPFEVPGGVSEGSELVCGYVRVPERHDNPSGSTIDLAVAVFRSSSPTPAADPLVLVRGGPGESTLTEFAPVMASSVGRRILKRRDAILIELRGTYYSRPSLACPEWDSYVDRRLGEDVRVEQDIAGELHAITRCYERLRRKGIDLAAFNLVESAADLPVVIAALGYDRYDLFATSAATLLAQHLLRDHPERLRSVILDSPLPLAERPYADFVLGADASLSARVSACANEPRCRAAFPAPAASLLSAIGALNRKPAIVPIENPNDHHRQKVVLNGDRVGELVYDLFADSEAVPVVPLLVQMLAHGDYSLVPTFGGALFHPKHFSRGLQYSALCAEEINFSDQDIVQPGRYPAFERIVAGIWPRKLLAGCKVWKVDQLPQSVNRPVQSAIPTLVMTGRFDILPSDYAPAVARNLSRSYVVTVPDAAHTPTGSSSCAVDIAGRFLDNPTRRPDTSCLSQTQVRFITAPLARRLLLSEPPVARLALLLVTVLAMLSVPASWVWRHLRRRTSKVALQARRTRSLIAAATGLNLVFLVVFFASNPLEIVYGYTHALRIAAILPLLSTIPAITAAAHAFTAWRRNSWRLTDRIHSTVLVAALLVFVWQLHWWYLLAPL